MQHKILALMYLKTLTNPTFLRAPIKITLKLGAYFTRSCFAQNSKLSGKNRMEFLSEFLCVLIAKRNQKQHSRKSLRQLTAVVHSIEHLFICQPFR